MGADERFDGFCVYLCVFVRQFLKRAPADLGVGDTFLGPSMV